MNREEIRAVEFPLHVRGYARNTIRPELARVAALHETGFVPARSAPPRSAGTQDSGRDCNRAADLGRPRRFRATGRQLADECEAGWRLVRDLPGVRRRKAGGKVADSLGQVLLTHRRRTMTLATGQVLRVDKSVTSVDAMLMGRRVTDVGTGEPVLWIGGRHSDRVPSGRVLLPGRRLLVFPVVGTRPGNAVMTAVTESGSTVLWFRRISWRNYEVVVGPDCDLATELLCVIDLAAGWLASYFAH